MNDFTITVPLLTYLACFLLIGLVVSLVAHSRTMTVLMKAQRSEKAARNEVCWMQRQNEQYEEALQAIAGITVPGADDVAPHCSPSGWEQDSRAIARRALRKG